MGNNRLRAAIDALLGRTNGTAKTGREKDKSESESAL